MSKKEQRRQEAMKADVDKAVAVALDGIVAGKRTVRAYRVTIVSAVVVATAAVLGLAYQITHSGSTGTTCESGIFIWKGLPPLAGSESPMRGVSDRRRRKHRVPNHGRLRCEKSTAGKTWFTTQRHRRFTRNGVQI